MTITASRRRLMPKLTPYLFILPTAVLFIVVLGVPLLNLFVYAFGDSNIYQGFTGWNSFANFEYLATSRFLKTVGVTLIWLVGGVVGIVVTGIVVALALNRPIPGLGLFRALIIIPWVVPHAFAAAMWSWVIHPQFGMLNEILMRLGLIAEPISFLSADTALATVIVVRIWQGAPFMIITLIAALQTVPSEIEEAADLDGVNAWQKFRYVTLPHIMPVLAISTLIISAWTLQIFDTVYIMTNGGPNRATQIVALDIYSKVFVESNLGSGAAIALVTLAVVAIIGWWALRKQEGNAE
ncbi:MAG: sugar ABC transporter permease [Microbacterium sp.]